MVITSLPRLRVILERAIRFRSGPTHGVKADRDLRGVERSVTVAGRDYTGGISRQASGAMRRGESIPEAIQERGLGICDVDSQLLDGNLRCSSGRASTRTPRFASLHKRFALGDVYLHLLS